MVQVYEANLEELATKGDLRELELRIENKFESLRGEFAALKGEFATLRGEFTALKGDVALLKWMVGFIFAGVLSLILKAFFA